MLKFGFHRLLHSDNVTEFKPKLDIKKTCPSPHHLQADGKLESSIRFIKDCIHKFSIDGALEQGQLLPYAKVTFNWFPNKQSQESPHFLYFGCDPIYQT